MASTTTTTTFTATNGEVIDCATPAGELRRRELNRLRKADRRHKFYPALCEATRMTAAAALKAEAADMADEAEVAILKEALVEVEAEIAAEVVTTNPVQAKPLTPFQKEVLADPATYGEGFGGKRKARGLAPLTADQRSNRKVLADLLGI